MKARWIVVLAMLVAAAAYPAGAQAAVWIVTSADDGADSNPGDGACAAAAGCTLRAAIQEANALAGADSIEFAIGSGVQTINIGSALPSIAGPATVDGTTQPGFTGSPIVVLDGGGSRAGLTISGSNVTLRGLVLVRFAGDGLTVQGSGHVLETNYVGIAADGTTAAGNSGSGIVLEQSSDNRIGGISVAQRNLISGNTGKGNGGGILLNGGSGNVIQGNLIGTDITGMLDRGNEGRGIALNGSTNNTIGGGAGAGNLIAGNRATAVRMLAASNGNLIQGNYLGINRTLTGFIKNDRGVQIRGSHANQVIQNMITGHVYDGVLIWQGASNNLIYGNLIAFNGQGPVGDPTEAAFNGVLVTGGVGNAILSNQIHSNAIMGIELGNLDAVTANDAGDGDIGANYFQNFPVVSSAVKSGGSIAVGGTLQSVPSKSYLVQLFGTPQCNASGHGEGRMFLGNAVVTTNAAGSGSFTASVVAQSVAAGWSVTATATDGGGNTSEFSACFPVR